MFFQTNTELFQDMGYGEAMLLCLIKSLSKKGKCYMTNKSLADVFNTSERTVQRWLMTLHQSGYITSYYEEVNGHERRVIEPRHDKNVVK